MNRFAAITLLCLALVMAPQARADRDIVYSARYYYPPSSRRVSHFHLYRINPDGTRRIQLTTEDADDMTPLWSPNGSRIAFLRWSPGADDADERTAVLCVIGANGGRIIELGRLGTNCLPDDFSLRWSADGTAVVDESSDRVFPLPGHRRPKPVSDQFTSPDGRYRYVKSGSNTGTEDPDTFFDHRTGKSAPTQDFLDYPLWLNHQTLLGVVGNGNGETLGLCILGIDGKIRGRCEFRPTKPTREGVYEYPVGSRVRSLQPIPRDNNHVVWWADESNSTVRPLWSFYRVDIHSGVAEPLCDGQSLSWSPDGKSYCVANRDLAPYGSKKRVWQAGLRIVDARTGKARNITPGIVWVDGAEWRKSSRPPEKGR